MSFNIGDRVILISGKYKDSKHNPAWGGCFGKIQGTVIKGIYQQQIDSSIQCHVKWDIKNYHKYTHNYYRSSDLKLTISLSTLPEELFVL